MRLRDVDKPRYLDLSGIGDTTSQPLPPAPVLMGGTRHAQHCDERVPVITTYHWGNGADFRQEDAKSDPWIVKEFRPYGAHDRPRKPRDQLQFD